MDSHNLNIPVLPAPDQETDQELTSTQKYPPYILFMCCSLLEDELWWQSVKLWVGLPVVQSPSCIWLFATWWTVTHQASLCLTISQSLPKFISSQWCDPAVSFSATIFSFCFQSFPALRPFPVSQLFPSGDPKYWSFSFSISLSNEYSELTSLRINWFDPLAVQGIVKSLLQHYSSKASILQHSAFFMVQLSHLHVITGKTIALTIWTLSAKWCHCFLIHCLGLS